MSGKFIRRVGGRDLDTNFYFNDRQYVGSGGYYNGNTNYQCVNYAIGRTCELAETRATYFGDDSKPPKTMFKRKGYGDAVNWIKDTNWEVTQNPNEVRLGDVVVYGSTWGSGYGHVRIVEAIEQDNFICSGGNEDNKGGCRFDIVVPKNQNGIIGFIHNPHLTYEEHHDEETDEAIEQIKKELEDLKAEIIRKDKEIQKRIDKENKIRNILDDKGNQ